MVTIKDLHTQTLKVVANLQAASFEELEQLVELREDVLVTLNQTPNISQVEKAYLRDIAQYDKQIIARMTTLRDEASAGLAKLGNNRKQRSSYDAQYEGESYFIDIKN